MKSQPRRSIGEEIQMACYQGPYREWQPPATDDKPRHDWKSDGPIVQFPDARNHIRSLNVGSDYAAEQSVKAHNRELAAERENLTLATQMVHIESKRANVAEQRLLSAQAAIEEARHRLRKHMAGMGYAAEVDDALSSIDLSALHKHDAELTTKYQATIAELKRIFDLAPKDWFIEGTRRASHALSNIFESALAKEGE